MGLIGPVIIVSYLPRQRFVAPVALAVGTWCLFAYDVVPEFAAYNTLAFRAATWQLPSGAASFIEGHHINARMFNNYEDGGYLIWRLWPLQRVFIDGRGLSEQAFIDYRRILNGSTDLLEKYGIEILVVEGFDYLSGEVYPVAVNVANSGKWALVYADNKGVVLMLKPPLGVIPLNPQSALLDSLAGQCTEHLQHDPIHPRCAFGLGELYAHQQNTRAARDWMSTYLQHSTIPDPEAQQIFDSLSIAELNNQAKGDPRSAERLLRQALAIAQRGLGPDSPDTAGVLNNLAAVLESEGNYAEAESLYRRSLDICEKRFGPSDPHTAVALDNLAGALESRGDLTGAEALLRRALSIAPPNGAIAQTIREDLDALIKAITTHERQQSPH
jgi:tetratricopeptide (TPR) repeat protein